MSGGRVVGPRGGVRSGKARRAASAVPRPQQQARMEAFTDVISLGVDDGEVLRAVELKQAQP
jgi:hypothetical protein